MERVIPTCPLHPISHPLENRREEKQLPEIPSLSLSSKVGLVRPNQTRATSGARQGNRGAKKEAAARSRVDAGRTDRWPEIQQRAALCQQLRACDSHQINPFFLFSFCVLLQPPPFLLSMDLPISIGQYPIILGMGKYETRCMGIGNFGFGLG
jgi:hypothetical protein